METPTHPDTADHDGGLAVDLPRIIGRRRALGVLGGLGLGAVLAACGADSTPSANATTSSSTTAAAAGTSSTTAAAGSCETIPEETAGPFPGDGSNGPNVLTESGVVREDITQSFGPYSGTAEGEPMEIQFTVLNTADGCAPYAGAAVYAWHADLDGGYSLYSDGVTEQNYLRGVGEADANGVVTFQSIFPACYPGRWPHIHFEVYPDLAAATSVTNKLATSQLAIPEDACAEVYASVAGYEDSAGQLERVSLDSDGVFRDGYSRELGTMSGAIGGSLSVALTIAV